VKRLIVAATLLALVCPATLAGPRANAECSTSVAPVDCNFQERISAVDGYLTTRPGTVEYVLRDRQTGAQYRNAHAGDPVWSASTIKLAIVVDLLTRQRAGAITLNEADTGLMAAMLQSSDDTAADTLWSRYGGTDPQTFNSDFPKYGMTDL
jgi:beta-lactamase class A